MKTTPKRKKTAPEWKGSEPRDSCAQLSSHLLAFLLSFFLSILDFFWALMCSLHPKNNPRRALPWEGAPGKARTQPVFPRVSLITLKRRMCVWLPSPVLRTLWKRYSWGLCTLQAGPRLLVWVKWRENSVKNGSNPVRALAQCSVLPLRVGLFLSGSFWARQRGEKGKGWAGKGRRMAERGGCVWRLRVKALSWSSSACDTLCSFPARPSFLACHLQLYAVPWICCHLLGCSYCNTSRTEIVLKML